MFSNCVAFVSIATLLASVPAGGADLQLILRKAAGTAPSVGTLSLHAPGETVSSMRFDIVYDASAVRITSIQPAEALTSQEKTMRTFEADAGTLRVAIVGMNSYPIRNGAVARIEFTSSSTAQTFRISNASGSDDKGSPVKLNATPSRYERSTP